ncbi:MAG TPA: hypothetical protein DEA08_29735 [Planctomycetes bacterium]|nr:hypothetical protein [Planctomycetota bacterium]
MIFSVRATAESFARALRKACARLLRGRGPRVPHDGTRGPPRTEVRRKAQQVGGDLLLVVAVAVLCQACSAPEVSVTVADPKVYGDDTVLRRLAEQREQLPALARGIRAGDYQEAFGVRHEERSRATFGVNLVDPDAPGPTPPPERRGRRWPWWAGSYTVPPLLVPGLTSNQQLRQRVDTSQQIAAYDLLFQGDARLRDRRSRVALIRFDLSFNRYVDLGGRRRFAVVEFQVRPKHKETPQFSVYLLSPAYSAMVSQEAAVQQSVSEYAAQVLGSWGGIGANGSYGSRERLREEFEALLETPLQFAVHDSRRLEGGGLRFAFAFGPRRRLIERGRLNPARWFGSAYDLAYELQPGPRTCQALVVFHDVAPDAPLELEVQVRSDGRLVAEEEVDVGLALRPSLGTFAVACPQGSSTRQTARLRLSAGVPGDVVLTSGAEGPTFSAESQVFVGQRRVEPRDVRVLGRGRLAVRVRPDRALRPGIYTGRVITPDQPDLTFEVAVEKRGEQ